MLCSGQASEQPVDVPLLCPLACSSGKAQQGKKSSCSMRASWLTLLLKAENPHQLALMRVSILVVEYSRPANTHPEGVRSAVLKLPPNEEYGAHPRICSNPLTGSGNSGPGRVSIACTNIGVLA